MQKGAPLPYAQKRVFGLLHRVLRQGDPAGRYYLGFYLVHWYEEHHVRVNGREIDMDGLKAFLLGEINIPSMFDDELEGQRPPHEIAEKWDQLKHQTT